MTATPSNIQFEDSDFEERASYDDLLGDYVATCTGVEDIVAGTGNPGWAFTFMVKGLPLTSRVYHRGGGKWKIREVFNALGFPITPDAALGSLDPNLLIGKTCVVTIVKEDKGDGTNESTDANDARIEAIEAFPLPQD